jgi:hypothetical protein
MTSRRRFISLVPLVPLLGAAAPALAQKPVLVDPKDPQAAALGYVVDATRADKARFPKYAAGQTCGSCALYQGAPNSASAPCAIYGGKSVPGKAWCNAWVKRA